MPVSTINQYFQSLCEIHGIAGRRFCVGSQNLASGPGHLCACGKSHGLPRAQDNNASLVAARIKGQTKCESTLQVSATIRIHGRKSPDFARLWQITLALVCMPTLKHQHLDAELDPH